MEILRFTTLTFLLLLASFAFPPSQTKAAPPEIELAGRSINVQLVTDDDELTPVAWPTEQIGLATDTVVTKTGDHVAGLLKARGIRPDAESYTLLYDLNPALEKVDPLALGIGLTVPKVTGGAQLQQKLASGHVVMLTIDKHLKDKLKSNVEVIKDLSPRFAALETTRFADSGKRQDTIQSVKDLVNWFEHMRETFDQRTAKPLRRVTILQAADESTVLRLILEQALVQGQRLSAEDQMQILAIHRDTEELIRKWDDVMAGELPPGESQYHVEVEIRSYDPKRVQNLRVYYVVAGLFRTPIINPPVRSVGFSGLGSGSSAMLPIKNYKIWAAQDGDAANPATAIADLLVRKPLKGNNIKVVLSVRP